MIEHLAGERSTAGVTCTNNCNQGRDCPHTRSDGAATFVWGTYGLVMLVVGVAIGVAIGWGW